MIARLMKEFLATELIVYADKVCVDEETVRLRSHIDAMSETLVCRRLLVESLTLLRRK